MSAADTVESLLKLGVSLRSAFTGAQVADGSIDWPKFLSTTDFKSIETEVQTLVSNLTSKATDAAIEAVDDKRTALLNGRTTGQLSTAELHQMSVLLDARGVLVEKQIKSAGTSASFFHWLVDSALPVLIPIAKDLIPLLL
jgi:hypothetical protein